ncbi:MAG: hypothetical protein LC723_11540 [Actinobacteria bacterium]|nr:hypothetical protein [Actinomycetota bacterium]
MSKLLAMKNFRHPRFLAWGVLVLVVLAAQGVTGAARAAIPEDPQQLWAARYNGPGNNDDRARSLAVSPDGSKVFVTGSSDGFSGQGQDYATVAYSTEGTELWSATYNGPANSDDYPRSIAVSPDGSTVFVTGFVMDPSDHWEKDYATVAYSATNGTQLWAAVYNGPGKDNDWANALAMSPDGSKVFVTGLSWNWGYEYTTIAYSATSGTQLWIARDPGPGGDGSWSIGGRPPNAIAVSPDGSMVFVTEFAYGYETVAFSAMSGTELWSSGYSDPASGNSHPMSIAASPDGSKVFVTGLSYVSDSGYDYATVAYSAMSGTELWASRYNGPGNADDKALSMAVSPDGSKVFVTGLSHGSGTDDDYATIAYSSISGTELWASRYNGPSNANDKAYSIAVSPDGSKVFVTGNSVGGSAPLLARGDLTDYATVAYVATSGTQKWASRFYNGRSCCDYGFESLANSLAVSPDGSKVFMMGYRFTDTWEDYVTVAYRSSTCASGSDESGPVSRPIHDTVEPYSGSVMPYLHGANCDVTSNDRSLSGR